MQGFADRHLPPRPHPTGPGMPDAAAPLTQGAKGNAGASRRLPPHFSRGRWLSSSCSSGSNRPGIGREDEGAPRAQAPQSPRPPRPGVRGARGPAP